jgi:hypothetical protein
MDPSYSLQYPNQSWESENVLHFYDLEDFYEQGPAKIIVRNDSNETLRYLRVVSQSMYLLFDLEAGSPTELLIPAPRWESCYLSVDGEFSSGRGISEVEEFLTSKPSTYNITVTNDGYTIENPHAEKYKGNWWNP